MSSIQLFNNGEFELHVTPDGDSFTVSAPGIARALGFHSAKDMLRTVPDRNKGWETAPTPGGNQKVWHLTEPGFYRVLGQRQPARIKNLVVREQVERFQDWIYSEVLPALRRGGRYERAIDDPFTYTWDEVTTIIRQRYGLRVSVPQLTRMLRTAGILRQSGVPKKAHQHFFWFTGTAWEIHPHAIPFLTRSFEDTTRQLQEFRFIQGRLELDGVGVEDPPRLAS
ncbi:BRO-N domain-containing protein [Amycolatopsis jejuensis]|uniref:BRO-N domain-containing protein n=1 Tax=Amycolatopsis jejuensis TaxID=330084 RepID=UPI00068FA1ED|nr:Bro-N domain-containing protein [Amycolatopsis jejuensis]